MNFTLANSLNILAIFYRYPPNSEEYQSISQFFKQENWLEEWLKLGEPLNIDLTQLDKISTQEWKQYFGIEYTLAVPPWGSVYLDEEGLMSGDSTLSWKSALQLAGVKTTITNEPLDHIGLSLMALATIATEDEVLSIKLFNTHISLWIFDYLNKLEEECDNADIVNFIQFTRVSLNQISKI